MRRPLAVSALALALAGCALPLPHGVQVPGKVTAQTRQQETLKVLPPGPRPDALPSAVVLGFLGAQSNADGRHAIAREFLASGLRQRWQDTGAVEVFDPSTLTVRAVQQTPTVSVLRVSAQVSARILGDGTYAPQTPALVSDTYTLGRSSAGWQLTDVPDGLRLSPADRDRSFRVRTAYFLAPNPAGDVPRLVPDQVFLPFDADQQRTVRAVVERLLRGPSSALEGSVRSAFPAGTTLRSVSVTPSGVVTVGLSGQMAGLTGPDRQAASAQLVWSLRQLGSFFTALRVDADGRVLSVPGEGAVQDADDWSVFDPDGLAPDPPVYYVRDERLRSQGSALPAGPATAGQLGDGRAVAVDGVAVSPDRTQVALLARSRSGVVTLRVGAVRATTYPVVLSGMGLRSPSWGSGTTGLWLLRGDEVLRQPSDGAAEVVPVQGGPGGGLQALAVSRDGVRVALVAAGRLWVGRFSGIGTRDLRIVGLTSVAAQLTGVTGVAWQSGTSLVVLGRLQRTFLAVQVAVDGSTATPFDGPGLPGPPTSVTASPDGVVVTARTPGERSSRLYRATGQGFASGPVGSAPAYPG